MRPISEVLMETAGDLSNRRWQEFYSSKLVTPILHYLDNLGLTTRQPVGNVRKRVLNCTLEHALEVVAAHPFTPPRRKSKAGDQVSGSSVVRVLHDPTALFEDGATIRSLEVFGPTSPNNPFGSLSNMPQPDEWPAGIEIGYQGLRLRNDPQRGFCVVGRL